MRLAIEEMKVLIIDNVDSFIWNLVQYVGELGAKPIVATNDVTPKEIIRINPGRIIISPGPGRPENAGNCIKIIKNLGDRIPILGVCLGHQAIAQAFGGKVVHAKTLMHGKTSMIKHNGSTIYKDIPNPFRATRYHSLSVDDLSDCLIVNAKSLDDDEVMGIKHVDHWIYGVQYHPESILTDVGKKILLNFLEINFKE